MLINYLTEESKKIYLHRFAKYITPYRNVANLSSWGQVLRPILKSCCTTVKIHPWWNAQLGKVIMRSSRQIVGRLIASPRYCFHSQFPEHKSIILRKNEINETKTNLHIFNSLHWALVAVSCLALSRVCEVCPKWWKRRVPHSSLTRSVLRRRRAASLSANLSLLLS